MTTFVLVHGAFHGAWCWSKLVDEIERRGHRSATMNLPVSDGTATFDDYAETIIAALPDEPCVLVGHSLGAMPLPLVAARRQVASVVFLCGVIPKLGGFPWEDAPAMEAPGTFDALIRDDDGTMTFPDFDSARRAFYGRCQERDAHWAYERLRPQNSSSLWAQPLPLTSWPEVPYTAICCTDDETITPEFTRHAAPERFGIEPIEIAGDHSPFLCNAEALADLLVSTAA
jgi:pimeloyl-ACP methyl ester carboxylesterase